MHIKKLIIENYKCFNGIFELDFENGINILVGDNEVGKSTILEAIDLALSGIIRGRYLKTEISQSLFNKDIVDKYLLEQQKGNKPNLPYILIELYFEIEDDATKALFEGTGNSKKINDCGIQLKIRLEDKWKAEYNTLFENEKLTSLPIEYYDFSWNTFARDDTITPRLIPMKSAFIDSSSVRYQNGTDLYVSKIIREFLDDDKRTKIIQAHRNMGDKFREDSAVISINDYIKESKISEKNVTIAVDLSTKTAWETSLSTYVEGIPFNFIGRGEQSIIKTNFALNNKKAKESNILLIEEPESHLTHSKLNGLINSIAEHNKDKQIIISTHSSFVANKLGLNNLILLNTDVATNERTHMRLTSIEEDTYDYFKKLPGYDTLRLILCRKAILVEGDSDELVVQKAYIKIKNKLPIEDTVDVISVRSLAFRRFLLIANILKQPVAIVTDNDGKPKNKVLEKYAEFKDCKNIAIFFDDTVDTGSFEVDEKPYNYNTLEPKLLKVNNLSEMNKFLGTSAKTKEDLYKYMQNNKTECAMKIFDLPNGADIKFPEYIENAIKWEYTE